MGYKSRLPSRRLGCSMGYYARGVEEQALRMIYPRLQLARPHSNSRPRFVLLAPS